MAKYGSRHVCQACGASAPKWSGRCEGCGAWNTIVEEAVASGTPGGLGRSRGAARPVTFESLDREAAASATPPPRRRGGIAEFDYDDNRFEIEDADCGGERFEVKLTPDFGFIRKSRD